MIVLDASALLALINAEPGWEVVAREAASNDATISAVNYAEVMSRVQIALRVADLDRSIEFYSRLFNTTPPSADPAMPTSPSRTRPLKLVLLEGRPGEKTQMDHLGVEVESTALVDDAAARLADAGLVTRPEEQTTCCYAVQDKVWVTGPGKEPWEVYTVTSDAPPRPGRQNRPPALRRRRGRHLLRQGHAGP